MKNTRLKSIFIIPAFVLSAVLLSISIFILFAIEGHFLVLFGPLLSCLPFPVFLTIFVIFKRARTSENLPLLLLVSFAGTFISMWHKYYEGIQSSFPLMVSCFGSLLLMIYIFWYSRYGRHENVRLSVGSKFPDIEFTDLEGNLFQSSSSYGKSSIFIFEYSSTKLTLILLSLFNTIGLADKLLGEIGVIMILSISGETIGPPADKEYAVDPKVVEKIIPSQEYSFK